MVITKVIGEKAHVDEAMTNVHKLGLVLHSMWNKNKRYLTDDDWDKLLRIIEVSEELLNEVQ